RLSAADRHARLEAAREPEALEARRRQGRSLHVHALSTARKGEGLAPGQELGEGGSPSLASRARRSRESPAVQLGRSSRPAAVPEGARGEARACRKGEA